MELLIESGALEGASADAIVVTVFEEAKELGAAAAGVDRASGGVIKDLLDSGDFKGKKNETTLLRSPQLSGKRVVVVGLGKAEDFTLDRAREATAKGVRAARDLGVKRVALSTPGDGTGNWAPEQTGQAIAEGVLLGLYQYNRFKTKDKEKEKNLEAVLVRTGDQPAEGPLAKGVRTGETLAKAVYAARDLVSGPSNVITPNHLAAYAKDLAARSGGLLKTTAYSFEECKSMGMGAFCGVAQGTQEPPQFIVMEYTGPSAKGNTVALVGKGITFDTGGISIKPSAGMDAMKYDMAGSAAVFGTMTALVDLKLPLKVVGIVPATENMPSGTAYKPGDILTSLSGQTMEITNTDAEGRVVLSDALTYAARTFKPDWMIDLATLTGACVVALGHSAIGMLGTDKDLMGKLSAIGDQTGERVWELPMWEEYQDLLKSDIADIKNSAGRDAGTIAGAVFLGKFVEKTPWVHLDIAGTAWADKEAKAYVPKGAVGVGVRLLTELLRQRAEAQ